MYCRAASVSRIFAHSVCHKLLKSVAAMAAMVPTALSTAIPRTFLCMLFTTHYTLAISS